MRRRPRVLIADYAPTRMGLRIVLSDEVDVCAEADDSEAAIRAAKREQPDVCLVARELSGDWLSAVRGISRAAPSAAVVVLAHDRDAGDLLASVRTGAIGYVPDGLKADQLRRIIAAVAANEAVVPRSMVFDLLVELRGGIDDLLTRREAQVLGLLRCGQSTAAIAEDLAIAPVTVRRHISELVHKLGVENRAALTAIDPRWAASALPNGFTQE